MAATKKRAKTIYCEFDGKVNGALSSDSDSRFLDRVTTNFYWIFEFSVKIKNFFIYILYDFFQPYIELL